MLLPRLEHSMFRFSFSSLATTVLFAVCITAAYGQAVDLVCSGTMKQYEPQVTDGNVGPAAARVDLARNFISTPLGDYRISRVEDTKIWFGSDVGNQLVAEGSLDRVSGQMSIWWQRAGEKAKMKAGLPSKLNMAAELRCSASKRLF
jgi:hypothetical protein